ncbi:MAG: cupin domain-containing protein [Proteobacteria bacterium]|nr:cupin domain-containing protein [Pseudomonadota bacterium]
MKRAANRPAAAPAIETQATTREPLGMSPQRFLRDYWQKRPLLIRGMFADGVAALTPEDLAGLACEDAAISRIVVRDTKRERWTLRNGPFGERDFARLGRRNWSLLVQDVDKWDMDVAALLERFRFIPSWRIDDIMVSYATDGGGVGPHVDQYDVFLIQGIGYRNWKIDARPDAPQAFRDDSELKLLREFAPSHEWLLDPGDVLYLPPGVPHDGVAFGECTTYSVGMRAPSRAELLFDFAEFLAEPLSENQRYIDPDLAPARASGEIDEAALARVRKALPHFSNVDKSTFSTWFGRFITRYRSAQVIAAPGREIGLAALQKRLPASIVLRNPFSRIAWRGDGRTAELFVAGEAWRCPRALAQCLAAQREIDGSELAGLMANASARETLKALLDAGHLQLRPRRR